MKVRITQQTFVAGQLVRPGDVIEVEKSTYYGNLMRKAEPVGEIAALPRGRVEELTAELSDSRMDMVQLRSELAETEKRGQVLEKKLRAAQDGETAAKAKLAGTLQELADANAKLEAVQKELAEAAAAASTKDPASKK